MSPQAGWILQDQIVPRLRSAIPRSVCCVGCEDPDELIQDGTAMAAKLLDNVEQSGKTVTPGNIAYYTIQHLKSGRRSTGSSVIDVLGTGTQLNGNVQLNSLDEPAQDQNNEVFELHDVIASEAEDPAMTAARNLDWKELGSRLSEREKLLLAYVLEGKTCSDLARLLGVYASTIQANKRNVARRIREFMGDDILMEVPRMPQWKNNLNATKDKLHCRELRK